MLSLDSQTVDALVFACRRHEIKIEVPIASMEGDTVITLSKNNKTVTISYWDLKGVPSRSQMLDFLETKIKEVLAP